MRYVFSQLSNTRYFYMKFDKRQRSAYFLQIAYTVMMVASLKLIDLT